MATATHLTSGVKPTAKKRQRFQPFVLWLVPILGLLMLFSVFPILASFYLSFFDFQMLQPLKFVGLNNFIYAITRDIVFRQTVVNTIYFALVSVPLGMAVSLIVAHLIFGRKHFQSVWRTIYFLPVVTPVVAIAIVWRFIYQPSKFGFLNSLLSTIGINPISWINSQAWVIPSLIFLSIWAGLGYNMVLFLAGLGGIPSTFYEAAKIDGANEWQMFWGITIPLLSPTILFTTITGTISAMQIFSIPYIMTRGGPENASRMWVMWIQEVGFAQFRMGYASSLAVLFFIFIIALTFLQLRLLRTQWSY